MAAKTESKKSSAKDSKYDKSKKRKFDAGKSAASTDADEGSRGNKKRALKHERQSHRRHFDEVTKAKALWNRLRLKSNTKEDIKGMMAELMELLTGRMKEVTMQHDASRVVQAAIQFGSDEQRKLILDELKGSFAEISKIQYAHFVVLKVITYCARDKEGRAILSKGFKGHITKLAVHAVGARVVELLFSTLNPKCRLPLKQELYGPHLALFAPVDNDSSSCPTLKSMLDNQPEKKEVALKYVRGIIDKGMEKGLFGFGYFQDLIWEYLECSTPNEIRDIVPNMVDNSIHMLSTRAGAKVVAHCAAYGTPKDRKRIMRSLKGYTRSSLLHRDAYIALLRLVDVTDDTVTVQKLLLNEILVNPDKSDDAEEVKKSSPLLDIALSKSASRLFLLILAAEESSYFDPFELTLLEPATITEGTETVSTSKKEPAARRKQIAEYLRKSLCDLCLWHTDELMRSKSGARVVREVYHSFPSSELADAIVETTVATSSDEKVTPMLEDPVGHLFIKNLLLAEAPLNKVKTLMSVDTFKRHNAMKTEVSFAKAFHEKYDGKLMDVASSNRGAFIVSALAVVDTCKSDVKKELKVNMSKLKQSAKEKKGFEALCAALK